MCEAVLVGLTVAFLPTAVICSSGFMAAVGVAAPHGTTGGLKPHKLVQDIGFPFHALSAAEKF